MGKNAWRMSAQVTSTGVVVRSSDGRVYIRKVAGGFGGYKWSFAKGRLEPGLSEEENALKELREEMGLEAKIVGVLGDYPGDTGTTRFFIGEATGVTPRASAPKPRQSSWQPTKRRELLNRPRDQQVLDDLYGNSAQADAH